MGKRVVLFLVTNLAIVLTLSIILSLLGVGRYIGPNGLDLGSLAIFCFVWGMGGAFISLQMSRWSAKRMTGVRLVNGRTGDPTPTGCTAPSSSSPGRPTCRCPRSASTIRRR